MTSQQITKPLYHQLLTISPQTLPAILTQLTTLLNAPAQFTDYRRLWKGIFLGLWNYDKLIPQHDFNTRISSLVHAMPYERAVLFLNEGMKRLNEYWERVDHHRINKYNQLLRYLLTEGLKAAVTKVGVKQGLGVVERALSENVFGDKGGLAGAGLAVLAMYVDVIRGNAIEPVVENTQWIYNLLTQSANKDYRNYILEHLFEKIKNCLPKQQVHRHITHTLSLAKTTESQNIRKSLFDLVGFLKSPVNNFEVYMEKKLENKEMSALKTKKKMTTGKRKEIQKLKETRKGRKKQPKKIISKKTIEMAME